jgi:Zn-dependent protease with chaperone function
MKSKLLPLILLPFLSLLLWLVVIKEPTAEDSFTLSPLYQSFGKLLGIADSGLSRFLAGGEDWDEGAFGLSLKKEMEQRFPENEDSRYLNKLLDLVLVNSKKDFSYRVFVDEQMSPNAYAMAGGVIVFSAELLELLETEAQVAAILAHEIGHIELDHCLNRIKIELAKERYGIDGLEVFEFFYDFMIGMRFSQTQETEADEYAFQTLVKETEYWPLALSEGFAIFQDEYHSSGEKDLLWEFFQSHPDMEDRVLRYREKALALGALGQRYQGWDNLAFRQSYSQMDYVLEWYAFPPELE